MSRARERFARLCRRLGLLVTTLLAIVLLAVLAGLWFLVADPSGLASFVGKQLALPLPAAFSATTLILLAAALLAQTGLLISALASLRRALREAARSDTLSAAAAVRLRGAGILFLAHAAATLLARPVVSLILSIDMPPGQRFFSLGLGSQELLALLLAGLIAGLGQLMGLAAEVDDENRRFV